MGKFDIGDNESAIAKVLEDGIESDGVTVRSASSSDFDLEGSIVAPMPAALVIFAGEQLPGLRDAQRLTYQSSQQFTILIGAKSLRSREDERTEIYGLLTQAKDLLAGARLKLSDGAKSEPVRLVSVEQVQVDVNGSWYALTIEVTGIAQFSGANA